MTHYAPEIKQFLGIEGGKKQVIGIVWGYEDPNAALNAYRSIKQGPDGFTRRYD